MESVIFFLQYFHLRRLGSWQCSLNSSSLAIVISCINYQCLQIHAWCGFGLVIIASPHGTWAANWPQHFACNHHEDLL